MKVSPISQTCKLYEETADSYSAMMDEEIELPLYAETLGGLAACIGGLEGAILDTSCGSGHMLAKLRGIYTPGRKLLGVDLSPRMVEISRNRLGTGAEIIEGDMKQLAHVESGTCAAVLSFFALHHLDEADMRTAFAEWHRVARPGGQLLVATWEGDGPLDYGDQSDIVAMRYPEASVSEAARSAGFRIDRCEVEPVEGMGMDAVYLMATK
jgi:ubiquinone/menaquinone biosynthesis C-methylase UbiE